MTSSAELKCSSCFQPKSSLKNGLKCGLCQSILCKDCAQFLDEEFFSFLKLKPDELLHSTYCPSCFDSHVVPAQESYTALIEKAKGILIYEKREKGIRVLKRARYPESVENCYDEKDALLRLAFRAAEQSFNAVIQVELSTKKIRNHGYQKSRWAATGIPATVRVSSIDENL